MRQKLYLSSMFLLIFFSVAAQSVKILGYNKTLIDTDNNIIKSVVDTFDVFQIDLTSFPIDSKEKINNVQLIINGKYNWTLQLEPNNILSEDCLLTTSNGSESKKLTNTCLVYKGYANDNPENEVRLSVYGNIIEGYIEQGSVRYYIEPLADFTNKIDKENNIVLFKGKNLKQKYSDFNDNIIIPTKGVIVSKVTTTSDFTNTIRFLRIATDADYEFYQIYTTNSNSKILAVLNQLESVYTSAFNIKFRVVFQNYYSSANDPYTFLFDDSETFSLLEQFRTEWNSNRSAICRDVAQLYSGKSQSSSIYGVGYANAIYLSSPDAYNAVKNRTLMHLTSAHELGHNFGASDNPSDGNCGNSQSSVMCRGEKKDPPWFSDISKSEITTFVSGHDYLTNRSTSFSPLICSQGANSYTVNHLPTGYNIQWNTSSNLTSTSHNDAGYYATLYSNGNGYGSFEAVTVRSSSCTCGNISLDNLSVWVGTPVLTIDGPSSGSVNNTYNFYANPTSIYYSCEWSVNPSYGNYLYPQTTYAFISFVEANRYDVMARATNTCGLGDYAHKTIYIFDNYKSYSLFPNPASDNVTINMTENPPLATTNDSYVANMDITKTSADEPTTYTIRVFNSYGTLLSSATRTGKSFTIPLNNLRDGIYIVEVRDGKNSYRQQLIVKHN